MSLFSDYEAEYEFEKDFPFGVPSDTWKTKDGRKIKVSEMTEQHIKNCMRLVGEDDGWYGVFCKELKRRDDISKYAHWIYPEGSNHVACICSHCGFKGLLYENDVGDMPYCPSCGFRMTNIKDVSINS